MFVNMDIQVKEHFNTFTDAFDYIREATNVYRRIKGSFTYDIGFESFGNIIVTIKPYYGHLQEGE